MSAVPESDGRRLRALRNREQVVDAILDLFEEGVADFDATTLAARAGVSVRSVYRYFEDRDALMLEGVARHGQRLAEVVELDFDLAAPLDERIERFVAFRTDRYQRLEPLIEVTRFHGYRIPAVAETLAARRALVRGQLGAVFGPELASCPAGQRRRLLASLDVATDYSSWRLLRHEHAMDDTEVHAAITTMVRNLLAAEFDG